MVAHLWDLPFVTRVTTTVHAQSPEQTIIHIKNWHLVSKKLFTADLRDQDPLLSDDAIERSYESHLAEVEKVQQEQLALLRSLIRHHGLKSVYLEGMTELDRPVVEAKVGGLRDVEKHLPSLREELKATRDEIEMLGEKGGFPELVDLRIELETVIKEHRTEMLRIGAAGQLHVLGELEAILPLDDLDAYRAANPLRDGGQIVLDQDAIEAREDAQVRILLRGNRVSVILLGGAHDLADNVRRLAEGKVELLVVETQGYRLAAGH